MSQEEALRRRGWPTRPMLPKSLIKREQENIQWIWSMEVSSDLAKAFSVSAAYWRQNPDKTLLKRELGSEQ